MLIGIYVAFGIFANIAATKTASFDLGISTFYAPAVILIFGVTFLLTDIVNERFGLAETRRMIIIAFISQLMISFFSWLAISLPSAPFYNGQAAATSGPGTPSAQFHQWPLTRRSSSRWHSMG